MTKRNEPTLNNELAPNNKSAPNTPRESSPSPSIEAAKAATRECKRLIAPLEVVTPSIFCELFEKIAKRHGVQEERLDELVREELAREVERLEQVSEESSRHIHTLDSQSKEALEAMRENDMERLERSIAETEKLREEIEKLRESLHTDALTKAKNRKWLQAHWLDEEFRFRKKCAIAIVDLNYFKQINDTLGHVAGDKVLRYIASHLAQIGVPVVRYGGDEFLLIFEGNNCETKALKRTRQNREDLLNKTLRFEGKPFKTSYSFGVAEVEEGTEFEEALQKADKRLYNDKQEIKKRVPPPFGK